MTKTLTIFDIERCPIRNTLKVLGGKWAMVILHSLREEEKRFSDIRRQMPDISEKMLIQNLKSLVDEAYIERIDYQQVPPKVGYKLTVKGDRALSIVDVLIDLGRDKI